MKERRGEILDEPESPQNPAEEAIDCLRAAAWIAYPDGRTPPSSGGVSLQCLVRKMFH